MSSPAGDDDPAGGDSFDWQTTWNFKKQDNDNDNNSPPSSIPFPLLEADSSAAAAAPSPAEVAGFDYTLNHAAIIEDMDIMLFNPGQVGTAAAQPQQLMKINKDHMNIADDDSDEDQNHEEMMIEDSQELIEDHNVSFELGLGGEEIIAGSYNDNEGDQISVEKKNQVKGILHGVVVQHEPANDEDHDRKDKIKIYEEISTHDQDPDDDISIISMSTNDEQLVQQQPSTSKSLDTETSLTEKVHLYAQTMNDISTLISTADISVQSPTSIPGPSGRKRKSSHTLRVIDEEDKIPVQKLKNASYENSIEVEHVLTESEKAKIERKEHLAELSRKNRIKAKNLFKKVAMYAQDLQIERDHLKEKYESQEKIIRNLQIHNDELCETISLLLE